MQYLPAFGESRLLQCMGSQQPSYNTPAFQVPSGAVSAAGAAQDYLVGEGEVVAVANGDGTGSFFFIPTAVRWSPDLCNGSGCFRNFCPNKNFTSGIWLVTSITNPVPVQVFSQVIQKRGCVVPPPVRSYVSDVNLNNIRTSSCVGPQFHAQFHNDGCTSTSDLHYFFPSLRCREWIPHLGACVQVDLPPKEGNTYHYECVNKPNGRNSMSVRSYDNNSVVESNSMSVDEDVSTVPETKDQYVFTVTENGMQTRTGISQPTQVLCNLDACVEMQTCELKEEPKTQICEFMTTPLHIKSSSESTSPCSCGSSIGSIKKIMSKTNGILQFQELPSQTDPPRQSQFTETFCTCSREPCECRFDDCDMNDKLTATFENSNIQTDPKTNVNTTQMCCCFNSNCENCDCIFNDAKNKNKLTTTFEDNNVQTDQSSRYHTEDAFSSCKPECCDQWIGGTSWSCQESDCQTTSKEIRSTSTGTYACVCENCNCGEDTDESEASEDEPYCTCHMGYCCCNQDTSSTTQNVQRQETEIRSSEYR